jgi:F0F1-type ATP synthase assembly protein I
MGRRQREDDNPLASDLDMPDSGKEVGLDFIDLLYAVPVAVLADRLAHTNLARVQPAGWADVTVALAAITFGWIGHHTNRRKVPREARMDAEKEPFTTLRLVQILVEILVIGVYLGLVTRAGLTKQVGVNAPSALAKAWLLGTLYLTYLAWDILDILIADKYETRRWRSAAKPTWQIRACRGGFVTLVFVCVFWCSWGIAYLDRARGNLVILFDLATLVCLYAYRVIQQKLGKRSESLPRPKAGLILITAVSLAIIVVLAKALTGFDRLHLALVLGIVAALVITALAYWLCSIRPRDRAPKLALTVAAVLFFLGFAVNQEWNFHEPFECNEASFAGRCVSESPEPPDERGPRGPRGPRGSTGPEGAQGPTGPKGRRGERGSTVEEPAPPIPPTGGS